MGDLWRSRPMQMVQLFIPYDAAHDTIDELGQTGNMQFTDMNPDVTAFQRNFVNEVKRCDETERKLRFLQEQLDKELEAGNAELKLEVEVAAAAQSSAHLTLDQLEARLEQEEAELLDANGNTEMLERNRNELMELQYVLEKDTIFFNEEGGGGGLGAAPAGQGLGVQAHEAAPLLGAVDPDEEAAGFYGKASTNLGFVTGVVNEDKFLSFERVLWRATRGNLYMKHAELEDYIRDPHTGEQVAKYVFIIFFQGQRVEQKIRKICEAFKANLYPCPDDPEERRHLLAEVDTRLNDLDVVLGRGKAHRTQVLIRVAKELPGWWEKIHKEKAIYNTMNMFDYDHGRRTLIATGWCPVEETQDIQVALRKGTERSGSAVPSVLEILETNETPPTYFRLNKFTQVFQDMVDAYGVPRYGEINPAVFSIATFPFLFAVMYGDVGHGMLMVMALLPLLIFEKRIQEAKGLNEIFMMMFSGRYLLFMMAVAAVYTGSLYNEVFSVPMHIFESAWSPENCNATAVPGNGICKDPTRTYPWGIDPAFRLASNELLYTNSLKMKMSIILGVTHMTMGIFMHLLNGLHFRKMYDVLFEFIPQLVFLFCLFGYLCFLVFYKWAQDYGYYTDPHAPSLLVPCPDGGNGTHSVRTPPQLIGVMITVALPFFGGLTCDQAYGLLGGWQVYLQYALLGLAVLCIPTLLVVKPCLLKRDAARGIHDPEHGEHFEFGEVFVHQMIHAIEFILGTISNTASYLRLWALSLAHSELSIVFYERALVLGLSMGASSIGTGIAGTFITWGVWAAATVGVLIVMEALSAFLHALRLHWVEFQNKFFHGDGKPFTPFSYKLILEEAEEGA